MNMIAPLGILMLSSQFPRIPGDLGNPDGFDFPVLWEAIDGATPRRVVQNRAEGLVDAFIAGGHRLIDQGAAALTTSCGFLGLHHRELARALPVPLLSSSLQQVGMVNRVLPPPRMAGILTIDAQALSNDHLSAVGVPLNTPIGGMDPASHFATSILQDRPEMDISKARREVVEAAIELHNAHPDLGAIVLECTNMTPYAGEISATTKLPVYSIMSAIKWLRSGLTPDSYD